MNVWLMIVTISATILHLVRGEMSSAGITSVLFALAVVVAYGRQRIRPIRARAAAPPTGRPNTPAPHA